MLIIRIDTLPFRLSKAQRNWLEKMKADQRENVKQEAECAWEMRFNPEFDWVGDGPREDYPDDDLDLPF